MHTEVSFLTGICAASFLIRTAFVAYCEVEEQKDQFDADDGASCEKAPILILLYYAIAELAAGIFSL